MCITYIDSVEYWNWRHYSQKTHVSFKIRWKVCKIKVKKES